MAAKRDATDAAPAHELAGTVVPELHRQASGGVAVHVDGRQVQVRAARCGRALAPRGRGVSMLFLGQNGRYTAGKSQSKRPPPPKRIPRPPHPDRVLALIHRRAVRALRHVVLRVPAGGTDAPAHSRLGHEVHLGLERLVVEAVPAPARNDGYQL
jgi:hypothetical protein